MKMHLFKFVLVFSLIAALVFVNGCVESERVIVDVGNNGSIYVMNNDTSIGYCSGDQCSYEFPLGTSLILYAIPKEGFKFKKWQGDTCGDNHLDICTITTDWELVASLATSSPESTVITINITALFMPIEEPPSNIEADDIMTDILPIISFVIAKKGGVSAPEEISCGESKTHIFGIGNNRNCTFNCEWWDLLCHGKKLDCERLRLTQQLLGFSFKFIFDQASSNTLPIESMNGIPPSVTKYLKGFYPNELIAGARYQDTRPDPMAALGNPAVTLENKIAFASSRIHEKTENGATHDNIFLWAHEMEHVYQYRLLGWQGFIQKYADDLKAYPGAIIGSSVLYEAPTTLERAAEIKAECVCKAAGCSRANPWVKR